MIFHMYWDVISVEVIAGFFKKLFGELAFDQVVNVRQAVYQVDDRYHCLIQLILV